MKFFFSSQRIGFFGGIIDYIEIKISSTDKTIGRIRNQFILSSIKIRMRQMASMIRGIKVKKKS